MKQLQGMIVVMVVFAIAKIDLRSLRFLEYFKASVNVNAILDRFLKFATLS